MYPRPWFAIGLAFLLPSAIVRAEVPRSLLHLVPEQADFIAEVKNPRQVIETVIRSDFYTRAVGFSAAKEALGGTKVRRFTQLVAFFEKELGLPWPELLERLAGGGAVVAVKFAPDPAPALVVIQGKDEPLLRKFFTAAMEVSRQELARQGSKEPMESAAYQEIPTLRIGSAVFAASAGTALIVSNNKGVFKSALDLHLGNGGKSLASKPAVAAATTLLPPEPLVRLWVNMAEVHKKPEAKALYKMPRDEPLLTVLFGGYLDLFGRAPWFTAGLHRDKDGLLVTVRLPRGREGMGADGAVWLPPPGQPGSRPLLKPKAVLYSDASYFDQGKIWQDRAKLFNPKQNEAFEKADKDLGKFLSGLQLSKLLNQAGAYRRFVAVNQPTVPYAIKPKQSIPAFAFVLEMREPDAFAKSMNAVLRGAALLALAQDVKIKLQEESHGGCEIVEWRFDETARLKDDVDDLRFNFSPCFTKVRNQFVACSTVELCRELVDILKKEEASSSGEPARSRTRLYGAGVAAGLQGIEDQLFAQTILDQALPPGEAKAQVRAFIELVRHLGDLSLDSTVTANEFHYDVRLGAGK